jgi:uncharacterized protein
MSDAANNPYANPVVTARPLTPAEEKQWAILTHVLGIFFGFISAIVIYIVFRDRGPFVRAHVATEWNLQLTVLIFSALGFLIAFASIFSTVVPSLATYSSAGPGVPSGLGLFFLGYFSIIAIRIAAAIFGIVASVAANRGQYYRYPVAIRFVK